MSHLRKITTDVTQRSRKAFTLIELLVVIAIIAILAAILFPVFARARENARRASCQSNLHQIGLAMLQYTQDYDEKYPPYYYAGSQAAPDAWPAGNKSWYWYQDLYPYTKSDQVYVCPDSIYYIANGSYPDEENYGANWLMTNPPVSIASLSASADTYLFMDAAGWVIHPTYVIEPYYVYWLPGTENIPGINMTNAGDIPANYDNDWANGRHFQGVNICYGDGHVKWQLSTAVYGEGLKWKAGQPNAWDPTNPD